MDLPRVRARTLHLAATAERALHETLSTSSTASGWQSSRRSAQPQGALAAVALPETCSLSTRYTSGAPPIGRITCGTPAGILTTTPGASSSVVGLRVPFGLARIPPSVDDVLCAAIERFRQDRTA